MNFRENPYVHMFYKPQNAEKEELFVPDCDDFVVFYVKNTKILKTYKLFCVITDKKNQITIKDLLKVTIKGK